MQYMFRQQNPMSRGLTSASPVPRPGSPNYIRNSLRLPAYDRQVMLNLAMTAGGLREQQHAQQHAQEQLAAYRLERARLEHNDCWHASHAHHPGKHHGFAI